MKASILPRVFVHKTHTQSSEKIVKEKSKFSGFIFEVKNFASFLFHFLILGFLFLISKPLFWFATAIFAITCAIAMNQLGYNGNLPSYLGVTFLIASVIGLLIMNK